MLVFSINNIIYMFDENKQQSSGMNYKEYIIFLEWIERNNINIHSDKDKIVSLFFAERYDSSFMD